VNRPEGARTERRGIDRLARIPGGPDEHARRSPAIAPELPAALSVAAHDVAEALRVVSGYAELLEGDAAGLDDSARRFLAGITDGVVHLDSVLTGFLSYVRVNVEPLEITDVDFNDSLDEARRPLHREIKSRGARIEAGELPTLPADAAHTRELLRALVHNGLCFGGDEPPVITVSAERNGDRDAWRFSVRDAGIGVPADAYERVLQPFERAHSRSVSRGAGLGLAVARRIAERRGGRLWLEAAPERGTVVHFTVPDRVPSA
jgi:light-regulated signal transduction histidine kinase (bacteriophytochrome)